MADKPVNKSTDTLPGDTVACCVQYDGSAYSGWQSQSGVKTVQDAVEAALSRVANESLRVYCAGRTDTGVHATAQWIHFASPCERGSGAWVRGGNAYLPDDIRLVHTATVAADFHARHSAVARHYRYIITNTAVRSALNRNLTTWVREPLEAARMHEAAQALLGEQDFSAFRASSCQSLTAMRCVKHVSVQRSGSLIAIDISANAFLHHMVRNIAGTLIAVGSGRQDIGWVDRLLRGRDRTRAAATAAPQGLYLTGVSYPGRFGLPDDLMHQSPLLLHG